MSRLDAHFHARRPTRLSCNARVCGHHCVAYGMRPRSSALSVLASLPFFPRLTHLVHAQARPTDLTTDHKPDHSAERARIEAAGGVVAKSFGASALAPYRVWDPLRRVGLATSRAFGDTNAKAVTHDPDIRVAACSSLPLSLVPGFLSPPSPPPSCLAPPSGGRRPLTANTRPSPIRPSTPALHLLFPSPTPIRRASCSFPAITL